MNSALRFMNRVAVVLRFVAAARHWGFPRPALLALLFLLGCEADPLLGATSGDAGASDGPVDASIDLFGEPGYDGPLRYDLRPPPDLAICAPGRLAFGLQINTPTMDFYGASLALADLDGNGMLDVIVGGGVQNPGGAFGLLLGRGDGTFRVATYEHNNAPILGLAAGDWNSDGRVDVAISDAMAPGGPRGISILIGDGAGGISERKSAYSADAHNSNRFIAMDFDRDGHLDLFANFLGFNVSSVLLGNGDGTFRWSSLGQSGLDAVAADFDNDGNVDVAFTVTGKPPQMLIYRGDGKGGFFAAGSTAADPNAPPGALVAADFDGDGKVDLASAARTGVALFRNTGSLRFAMSSFPTIGKAGGIAAADFDGDHQVDLVVQPQSAPSVEVMTGRGDGTFSAPMQVPVGQDDITAITAGLIDSDCRPDIVVARANHQVTVILNASR